MANYNVILHYDDNETIKFSDNIIISCNYNLNEKVIIEEQEYIVNEITHEIKIGEYYTTHVYLEKQ